MSTATSAQWHSNPLNSVSGSPPPQYAAANLNVKEQSPPQASAAPPFHPPNATRTHAGGVSVDLQLERTMFVARGAVSGRVLVNVDRVKGVKVGRILVEVFGYEETTPARSAHRRLLLHHALPLQEALNASAMPTDVVVPGPPDEHGMWQARKGKHPLAFAIPLESVTDGLGGVKVNVEGPRPLPSSFWSREIGGVRYIVTCTVDIKTGHSKPLAPLCTWTPFMLLESIPPQFSGGPQHFPSTLDAGSPLSSQTTGVVDGRYLFGFGKKGEVKLRASAKIPTSVSADETGYQPAEGAWVAGTCGLVGVEIENGCQRRVTTLKVRLIRRLKTFSQHANAPINPINNLNSTTTTLFAPQQTFDAATSTLLPLSFSREVIAKRSWRLKKSEQLFEDASKTRGVLAWKGVGRGETRSMVLDLPIPILARSIRYAALLDVSHVIQVSIKPDRSRPLLVEIPITILHPASFYQNLPSPQARTTTKPIAIAPPITTDESHVLHTDPHVEQRVETPLAPSPASQNAGLEVLDGANVALAAERADIGLDSRSQVSLMGLTARTKGQVGIAGGTVSSIRAVEALRSVSVSAPQGPASRIGSVAGTVKGVDKRGSMNLYGKGLLSVPHVEMLLGSEHAEDGYGRNAKSGDHFNNKEDAAGNVTDGSDSIVPPENPPSPAARRAALSSHSGNDHRSGGLCSSFSEPNMDEADGSNEDYAGNKQSKADHTADCTYPSNHEEIARTIDQMFEGFPGIASH